MTSKTLTLQVQQLLEAKQVPEELHQLVGSTWHVLSPRGILLFGQVYTRGDEFTLTADTVAKSVNRLGESLLASFLSDDAQLAAWGEVRFAAGPRPDDFQQLLAGSTAWKLAKQAALARAGRYPYGTKLRDDAMREVEAQFGPGDIATGGQTNSHGGQVTP